MKKPRLHIRFSSEPTDKFLTINFFWKKSWKSVLNFSFYKTEIVADDYPDLVVAHLYELNLPFICLWYNKPI